MGPLVDEVQEAVTAYAAAISLVVVPIVFREYAATDTAFGLSNSGSRLTPCMEFGTSTPVAVRTVGARSMFAML